MPRPKDARVWNEDLTQALRARAELSRRQGKRNAISLDHAAQKIESVREDIYTYKNYNETGRIVNFPSNLPKTIESLCRKIITRAEPIYPDGYIPTNSQELQAVIVGDQNYYENDYFLNNIKRRGGAYAILMAFHSSQSSTMTKAQIIRAAQPHCDETMEANFHAGRLFGAWKGIDTLEKHNLVVRHKHQVGYNPGAGGFRAIAPASFTLTRDGERFIEAMLKKFLPGAEGLTKAPPSHAAGFGHRISREAGIGTFSSLSPASMLLQSSKPTGKQSIGDEESLQEWAVEAEINEFKEFNVSNERRKHLHDYCDKINATILDGSGKMIRHESFGTGRSRTLRVTMTHQLTRSNLVLPQRYESRNMDFVASSAPTTPSTGRKLSGDHDVYSNASERARTLPPKVAAAEAAFYRQAVHESKLSAQRHGRTLLELFPDKTRSSIQPFPPIAEEHEFDSDNDRKIPASSQPTTTAKKRDTPDSPEVVLGLDYDSNGDDIEVWQGPETKRRRPIVAKQEDQENGSLVDLTESQESVVNMEEKHCPVDLTESEERIQPLVDSLSSPRLFIYIDNRERDRNLTPRHLRMELSGILKTGTIGRIWSPNLPKVFVEEKRLKLGDFAFCIQNANGENDIPVWIERKRIGDLVQRSYSRDHWFQLHQLRDQANQNGGVCMLLLEGNLQTAKGTPFGAQREEQRGPFSHTIDCQDSLWFFVARAILSAKSLRFWQANDEQASLRAVGAVALMSASSYHSDLCRAPHSLSEGSKATRTKLQDRLKIAGIPWKLVSRISDEIGSEFNMNLLYSSSSEDSRDGLLAHVIADLVDDLEYRGTAFTWSAAVHRCFFSSLQDPATGRICFDDCYGLVEDHATLLAKIHSGYATCESAVNAVFDEPLPTDDLSKRVVKITLPLDVVKAFEAVCNDQKTFYELHNDHINSEIPAVVMETMCSRFQSNRVFVFMVDGNIIVERLLSLCEKEQDVVSVSRQVAKSIRNDCLSHHLKIKPDQETFILLIRGLSNAVNQCLKRSECPEAMKTMTDLVLAECSLRQGMVILQAVRLQDDRERIVRQIGLACYHFQNIALSNAFT